MKENTNTEYFLYMMALWHDAFLCITALGCFHIVLAIIV